jgi:hypothetical protein
VGIFLSTSVALWLMFCCVRCCLLFKVSFISLWVSFWVPLTNNVGNVN